jgi:hypothetical protein
MTGALTPAQALAYLLELSPGITAARIVDRAGAIVAAQGATATVGGDRWARPEGAAGADRAGVVRVSDDELELIAVMGGGGPADLVRADAAASLAAVRRRC